MESYSGARDDHLLLIQFITSQIIRFTRAVGVAPGARAAASCLLSVGMIRGGARTPACWDPSRALSTGPQRGET